MPEDKYQNGYNTGPSREESQAEISETARAEEQRIKEQSMSEEEIIRNEYSFFDDTGELSLKQRALRFAKGRKKTLIGLVLTVMFGAAGFGGFLFFSKAFELTHIMANLTPFNFGITNENEGSRTTRMLQRLGGCSRPGGKGFKQCSGNALTDKINDWRLDKLETKLANGNIKFNFDDPNSPRMTSIDTPDGPIKLPRNLTPIGFKRAIKPIIKDNVRLGRRIRVRNLITARAGFDWRFYATRKVKDGFRYARNKIRGYDTSQDGSRVKSAEGEEKEPERTKEARDTTQEGAEKVNEEVEEIRESAKKSGDIDGAARSSAREFASAHKGSLVVGTVIVGCVAKKYAGSLKDANKKLYRQLLNYMGLSVTADHEMRAPQDSGKNPAADQVGGAISIFHDNELNEHFNQSAAWKRVIGEQPTGNEKDAGLQYGNEGQINGASRFVQTIGNVVSRAGVVADGLCNFVTNGAVQYIADGAEIVLGFFSGGTYAAIREIAKEVAFEIAFSKLLAQLSNPSMLTFEGPQTALATLDMSMNLTNVEQARSIGATPASNAQVAQMRTEFYQNKAKEDRQKGLVWRYLSLDNPRSIASRARYQLIDESPGTMLAKLINFPNSPQSTIQTALSPIKSRAYARKPFNNYGLQQFAFTDKDLKIDAVNNANYIEENNTGYRCQAQNTNSGQQWVGPNGSSCNFNRWDRDEKIDLYQDKCMDLPYPEAKEGNVNPKGEWLWEKETRDGELNRKVRVDCNERTELYVRVGMYRHDNYLAGNLKCLSNEGPCENQNQGAGSGGSSDGAGDGGGSLPEGSQQQLAQKLLDLDQKGSINLEPDVKSQVQEAAGGKNILDPRIMSVLVNLAQNHEFEVTSMRRSGPCGPGNSRHNCGMAADISGSYGIDGATIPGWTYNQTVQNFIYDAGSALLKVGSNNCGLGVPNAKYEKQTQEKHPNCTVFIDKGTAPHVHLDVRQ